MILIWIEHMLNCININNEIVRNITILSIITYVVLRTDY